MSEANQTADTNAAREAAMSRVTTLDNLLPKQTVEPTSEATEQPNKDAPAKEEGDGKPAKKGINERITQLVAQRKEAEAQAADAKREAEELRKRVEALSIKPDPIASNEPQRKDFSTQEEYESALVDYRVDQRIAARERAQAEAQAKAESQRVESAWAARCASITKEVEDFADAVSACEEPISPVVETALKRSEAGPQLLYYFAKHVDDLKKVNGMHPVDAVRYLDRLERELGGDEPTPKQAKPVERSKAPAPITQVRLNAASDPGGSTDFATYRARRQAEKGK